MAWDIGNLFKAMKDDKGLFQGGEEGRVGGRFRDMLQGKRTSYDPGMEEGNELSRHARDFAKNMDVGSKEDVFEMQNMLNELGIKDFEGKALKADSMMGDRTTSAMRILQGLDYEGGESVEPEQGAPWSGGEEDGNTGRSWINKLFGGAGRDTRKARNSLFERTYDTSPDAHKKGGSLMWKRKGSNQGSGPGPWGDGSGY
tara:strand:+ start:59 stop:658 length:600 start_codon:yes stop_codon:yes gene_type:complete